MAKILDNTTGAPINISDTGVTVDNVTDYTIPTTEYDLWAASSDIITEIGAGNIVVNDGASNLSISDGVDLLKDSNNRQIDTAAGGLISVVNDGGVKRLALDVKQTSSNDFITKVSGNDTTGGYLEDKIVSADTKLTVSTLNDGANEDIQLAVNEANIDHDALSNFVANEHIDWTTDQGATNIHAGNYTDTNTTDHTALSNIGTNTHAQIDTHISNVANPHSVDIDDVTPTTTKGDIIVENGTNAVRVAVGTNDQVLTADSAEASGVKWAAAGGSITTSEAGGTDEISTTSNGATPVTGCTFTTPAAGDYLVIFSGRAKASSGTKAVQIYIAKDGDAIVKTRVTVDGNDYYGFSTHALVTVNGSEDIGGEWTAALSDTAYMQHRNISILKIG